MARPINIKLILDALGYVRGAKRAGAATADLGKGLDRADSRVKSFGRSMLGLGAGIFGALGAMRLLRSGIRNISDSVRLAGIQDITEKKLAQAITNTGDSVREQLPEFKNLAAELQSVTNFGDEAILTAQSLLLATEGLNSEGVRKLTPSMLNLASAMATVEGGQVDLSATSRLMTQVMSGTTGQLSRYGIKLSEAEEAQLKAVEGMDRVNFVVGLLESRFGGLAEAMADPFVQLQNDVGDLKEEFGEALLPVLRGVAEEFREFAKHPDTIAAVQSAAETLAGGLQLVIDQLSDTNSETRQFIRALSELIDILDSLRRPTNEFFARFEDGFQRIKDDLFAFGVVLRIAMTGGVTHAIDLDKWIASIGQTTRDTLSEFERLNEEARQFSAHGRAAELAPAPVIAPPPTPISDEERDAIQKRAFARRELEISLLVEGEEKIRAQVALEFDKRREQLRELFDGLPDDIAANIDALQEQTEARLVREFRLSLLVDVETDIDSDLLDDELEVIPATLDELADLVNSNLLTTVNDIRSVMAQLQEAFDSADTQEARDQISALMDTLDEAADAMSGRIEGMRVDFGALAADLVSGVAEAIGSGENIGDALLQTLGELAVRVGKISIAFGLVGVGIKKIAKANPLAAVVAGAALVALGRAAQAAVGSAVEGGAAESPRRETREPVPFEGSLTLERTVVLPGRAEGGPVEKGQDVVTGEREREFFVPSARSTPGEKRTEFVRDREAVEVGKQGPEVFTPPEKGFIIPKSVLPSGQLAGLPIVLGGVTILPGLAEGGPVEAGKTVIVGEQGIPELFTPQTSGFILPKSAITSDVPLAFDAGAVPGIQPLGGGSVPSIDRRGTRGPGASQRVQVELGGEVRIGMDELAIRLREVGDVQNDLLGRS